MSVILDGTLNSLRAFASSLLTPGSPLTAALYGDIPPASAEQTRNAWLKVSSWILIAAFGLLFCATVMLGVFGMTFLDVAPGHLHGLDFHPYRIRAALTLGTIEAVLIAAFVIRELRWRQVENLLRESEERMALCAGAARMGLWRWEAGQDRFWMTEHCRAMFGIEPGKEYGLGAVAAAVHPDDQARVSRALAGAMANETTFEIEYRITIGDGQMRWVRCRGMAARGRDGKMTGLAGTVIDISERMKMQEEIDKQRESLVHLTRVGAIGELSGALAHELNQPLTAILSNAQAVQRMIGQTPINIAELRNAIADIIEDDSRAGDVIRHLRALLKKDESRREAVDMKRLVRKVMTLTHNELNARHVVVVQELEDDLPPVGGDAVQLQQLLLNLILNASEAMSAKAQGGGVIIISGAMADERMLQFSIFDTGPGIPPDIMDRLFEPFFSTKKQGLGLGLPICHAIVSAHGGHIRAENNAGTGAVFHVQLPIARREFA